MTPSPPTASLLQDIRTLLAQARTQLQRSVNTAMVQTYWQVGRLIVQDEQAGKARAAYGAKVLEWLSAELTQEFGKGFDASNLRQMRRLYLEYPIRETLSLELSWSHHCKLLRLENPKARAWYAQEAIANRWSVRALERQIGTLYYERLLSTQAQVQAAPQERASAEAEAAQHTQSLQLSPKDVLRDPYILDFLNLPHASVVESDVEQALMDNLQRFLLELGRGFAFVARQQRISVADEDFYVDLVFYHVRLKCYVLIDLKLGRLTHQDAGQMDTYVRIYDQHYKGADDNPSIGLILCSEKSHAVAHYSVLTDSAQLFAAKYLPHLPSEEELAKALAHERALLAESDV
jgi:predicted nuclease of restriction endonuclease-like (RecB) superfamily